jgi:hypothetical protein
LPHQQEEDSLSKDSSSIPNRIASAAGLYPVLQERSKSRRDTQKRLTMQQGAAPLSRLRNDRAPELQVKYVATDSLKPANRRLRKAYELQAARIEQSDQPPLGGPGRMLVH